MKKKHIINCKNPECGIEIEVFYHIYEAYCYPCKQKKLAEKEKYKKRHLIKY